MEICNGQYKQNQSKEVTESKKKHAIRIVNIKTCFDHTKDLFNLPMKLNIYKLNILNIAIFMHKVYSEVAPAIFFELFQKFSHPYPIGFQTCATRYLKQILPNVNIEFQAEEC